MTPQPVDVLVLSLGTTRGLRIADGQLAVMLRDAGASVAVSGVRIGAGDRLRRGYPLNDIVEAIAARRALASALRRHAPRSIVFSSTTAALLARPPAETPYAVWLDSPAALNRPGRRNAPVHALERRGLQGARLVLVLSPAAADALPRGAAPAVVIAPPLPAAPRIPRDQGRDRLVVVYTPDPKTKDLALVCRAWALTPRSDAQLVVTGIDPDRARAFLARFAVPVPPRTELAGMLTPGDFAALLDRAQVYLSAARWEDFGQAPLQALDRGAAVVSAPGGGPFPGLAIARDLAPRFVAPDYRPESLAAALQAALAAPEAELAAYRDSARTRLEIYRPGVQVERLRAEVLPALLSSNAWPR